ncbi:MAG: V-type ATP synthase subunit I [Candidatus Hydrothermarchaeales archaeon]
MFFPARMSKITAVVLDEYKEVMVEELHELGVAEIRNVALKTEEEKPLISIAKADERTRQISPLLTRTSRLVETLEHFKRVEKKPLIKAIFEAKKEEVPVTVKRDYERLVLDATKTVEGPEKSVKELEDSLSLIETEIEESTASIGVLEKLIGLDFDLTYLGESSYLFVTSGEVPREELGELRAKIESLNVVLISDEIDDRSIIVVAGLKEDKNNAYEILRKQGFEEFALPPLKGKPQDVLTELHEKIEELNGKKEKCLDKLADLADKHLKKLQITKELLRIEEERAHILSRFGKTERTFVIEGFVPKKRLNSTLNLLKEKTKGYAFINAEEPAEPEKEIPILLDNPGLFGAFEVITETYSMPKYSEVDPTFLIAIWMPLFFGICLTDGAYGVMLFAVSWFLYKRSSGAIKSISTILLLSSIPTIIFGILFGSVFGDFFQTFFGIQFGVFDPLQKAVVALILAFIIGAIHLNIGLILGIKRKIAEKDFNGLLYEQLWKVSMEIGTIFLILMMMGYPPIFYQIGLIFLGIGALIVFKSAGPLGIMDITALMGADMSYARLLALALATSAIAMTINLMSNLIGGIKFFGIGVGIPFAILLLVAGHFLNFLINAFGAFIHSMRLHYLEFYGMFYEGDGKKFSPFDSKRKLTKIDRR